MFGSMENAMGTGDILGLGTALLLKVWLRLGLMGGEAKAKAGRVGEGRGD